MEKFIDPKRAFAGSRVYHLLAWYHFIHMVSSQTEAWSH